MSKRHARSPKKPGSASRATAVVEFAMTAPLLVLMIVIFADAGLALIGHTQIVSAVTAGVQFAILAAQKGTPVSTIATQVASVVQAASQGYLQANQISTTINNGNPASDRCCVGMGSGGMVSWSCSSTTSTCPDGANPGVYVEVHASATFQPLFVIDTAFIATALTSDIIQRIQ